MNGPVPILQCRRGAERLSLPLEAQLTFGDQTVSAVIRDASPDEDKMDGSGGVGLLHHDRLPLREPLACRIVSDTLILSRESHVTLMWTRNFGDDGYLSGGRIVPQPTPLALQVKPNV